MASPRRCGGRWTSHSGRLPRSRRGPGSAGMCGRCCPAGCPLAGPAPILGGRRARRRRHDRDRPLEKESPAPTYKHSYGFHPIPVRCDNTNELLAVRLRPGNAEPTPPPTTSTCWPTRSPRSPAHRRQLLIRADSAEPPTAAGLADRQNNPRPAGGVLGRLRDREAARQRSSGAREGVGHQPSTPTAGCATAGRSPS